MSSPLPIHKNVNVNPIPVDSTNASQPPSSTTNNNVTPPAPPPKDAKDAQVSRASKYRNMGKPMV